MTKATRHATAQRTPGAAAAAAPPSAAAAADADAAAGPPPADGAPVLPPKPKFAPLSAFDANGRKIEFRRVSVGGWNGVFFSTPATLLSFPLTSPPTDPPGPCPHAPPHPP